MASAAPTTAPRAQDIVSSSSDSGSSTESEVGSVANDEGWEDVEPVEEQDTIVSLLDTSKTFPSVSAMLEDCKAQGLDFLKVRDELKLDFYGSIKLVNYIRTQVKEGKAVPTTITRSTTDIDDDKYLKPVLEDDAFLFNLDELPEAASSSAEQDKDLLARVAALEDELRKTQIKFGDYRDTVAKTLDERWMDNSKDTEKSDEKRDDDSHYFTSYSYNDIHETMLKDTVRTDAYRDFIYNNKHLFLGKTVLDVGCGTGILSMFCAKAGAARVIAVDNSDIIDKARENVFNNGFADTITLLRGKVEEVVLPVDKVDIIVSEWMGYCLLYEAMLDSVIWARDKYLRPDGLMVPSHMNMWVAPVADPEYVADHFSFWRDVYGFDMKAMQAGIYDEASVLHMPTDTMCGTPSMFRQLSLHTTTVKDLSFKTTYKSTLDKDIDALDGFDIWFDTFFLPSRDDTVPLDARAEEWKGKGNAFTTGPWGKETHWRQGVMFIEDAKKGESYKKGDVIEGELEYAVPEENSRALNVEFSWAKGDQKEKKTQKWRMR